MLLTINIYCPLNDSNSQRIVIVISLVLQGQCLYLYTHSFTIASLKYANRKYITGIKTSNYSC